MKRGNCMKLEQRQNLQNEAALYHDPECGMDIEEQDAAGTLEH
jgi:hypothetical protein